MAHQVRRFIGRSKAIRTRAIRNLPPSTTSPESIQSALRDQPSFVGAMAFENSHPDSVSDPASKAKVHEPATPLEPDRWKSYVADREQHLRHLALLQAARDRVLEETAAHDRALRERRVARKAGISPSRQPLRIDKTNRLGDLPEVPPPEGEIQAQRARDGTRAPDGTPDPMGPDANRDGQGMVVEVRSGIQDGGTIHSGRRPRAGPPATGAGGGRGSKRDRPVTPVLETVPPCRGGGWRGRERVLAIAHTAALLGLPWRRAVRLDRATVDALLSTLPRRSFAARQIRRWFGHAPPSPWAFPNLFDPARPIDARAVRQHRRRAGIAPGRPWPIDVAPSRKRSRPDFVDS